MEEEEETKKKMMLRVWEAMEAGGFGLPDHDIVNILPIHSANVSSDPAAPLASPLTRNTTVRLVER